MSLDSILKGRGDVEAACKPYFRQGALEKFLEEDEQGTIEKIAKLIEALGALPLSDVNATAKLTSALERVKFFSRSEVKDHPLLSRVLNAVIHPRQKVFASQLVEAGAFIDLKSLENLIQARSHGVLEKICEEVLDKNFKSAFMEELLSNLFRWASEDQEGKRYIVPLYDAMKASGIANRKTLRPFWDACATAPSEVKKMVKKDSSLEKLFDRNYLIQAALAGKSASLLLFFIKRGGKDLCENERVAIFDDVLKKCTHFFELEIFEIFRALFPDLSDPYLTLINFARDWLCHFAEAGFKELIEKILALFSEAQRMALLNKRGQLHGWTPLLSLCSKEKLPPVCSDIAHLFLQYGADPIKDMWGNSALHLAIINHHFAIFQHILRLMSEKEQSAGMNGKNRLGQTPLASALHTSNYKAAEWLLDYRAKVLVDPKEGETVFSFLKADCPSHLKNQICAAALEELSEVEEISRGTNLILLLNYIESGSAQILEQDLKKLRQVAQRCELDGLEESLARFGKRRKVAGSEKE